MDEKKYTLVNMNQTINMKCLPLVSNKKFPPEKVSINDPEHWIDFKDKNGNYGVLCGNVVIPKSECKNKGKTLTHNNGVIVVDIDFLKPGKGWSDKLGEHPFIKKFGMDYIDRFNTFTVRTQSGGYHIYFKYSGHKSAINLNNLDIDILSDGKYAVGPGSSTDGNTYDVYKNVEIQPMPDELKKWLDEQYPAKKVIKVSKSKIIKKTMFDSDLNPDSHVINILYCLLKDLPMTYCDETEKWRKVGWCLRSIGNCLELFRLFRDWSMQSEKYKEGCCKSIWKSYCPGKISIRSLIYYHKKECKGMFPRVEVIDDKSVYINYENLYFDEQINLMDGVDKIENIKIVNLNQPYLTDKEGNIDIFETKKTLHNQIKNKCILIKSITGSGKTTFMKDVKRKMGDKYLYMSILSRKSLAKDHSQRLDLTYYLKQNWKKTDVLMNDIAIQLDSIDKINKIGKPYILFIDEINSVLDHMKNNMTKMSKHRKTIIVKFWKFIKNAFSVIAVDADLSVYSMKYISRVLDMDDYEKKEIELYWNEYIPEKVVDVYIYHPEKIKQIIYSISKCIENDEPIFVCSDTKGMFERIVVEPLMCHHPDKVEMFKYYSAETGNKDDLDDTSELEDKFVFASPTITYGLDLNYKAKVFGIYFGVSINALNIVQQLARIRQPTGMSVIFVKPSSFIRSIIEEPTKLSLEEFIEEQKKTSFEVCDKLGKIYESFLFESEYYNSRFKNISFHVEDILKQRGHKIHGHSGSSENLKKMFKKKNKNVWLSEKMNEFIDYYDNVECKEDRFDFYKACNERMEIMAHFSHTKLDIKKANNLINSCIVDNHMFEQFKNLHSLLSLTVDDLEGRLDSVDNWVSYHYTQCNAHKLLLLHRIAKETGIDIFVDTIEDIKKVEKKDYNVTEETMYVFRLTDKSYKEPLNKYQQYKLIMELLHKLVGGITMEEESVQMRFGKDLRYRIKEIDYKILNDWTMLICGKHFHKIDDKHYKPIGKKNPKKGKKNKIEKEFDIDDEYINKAMQECAVEEQKKQKKTKK